ncbi:MAG: PIN domain nuclease [Clostridia bacterium]|nr:PIN domain nuclease [Clostridia bacterium]
MRRLKVYLDTSVISHLDAPDKPDWMEDTLRLWKHIQAGEYDLVLSEVVFEELAKCDEQKKRYLATMLQQVQYRRVTTDKETVELAGKFVDFGILNEKCLNDRRHIAAALLAGCDIIVSWNFKHIVNAKTIVGTRLITTSEGFKDVIICTPPTLAPDGGNDDE